MAFFVMMVQYFKALALFALAFLDAVAKIGKWYFSPVPSC